LPVLHNIIVCALIIHVTTSFSISHDDTRSRTILFSASETATNRMKQETIHRQQEAVDLIIQAKAKKYFSAISDYTVTNKKRKLSDVPAVEERFLTFTMEEHKPLGCTAEESLVPATDGATHVFISKVTEGGNADMVGIEVGDVIVGVSGSFDDVVVVVGSGLNEVRSLVAGRQTEMNLILKVIRNTNVQTEHEKALVDMCILPDGEGKDSQISKCISALYDSEYEIDDMEGPKACEDTETQCMVDMMLGSWGDELNEVMGITEEEHCEGESGEPQKESKGWSWGNGGGSRSGTYVRDPKTRKMVNIDE